MINIWTSRFRSPHSAVTDDAGTRREKSNLRHCQCHVNAGPQLNWGGGVAACLSVSGWRGRRRWRLTDPTAAAATPACLPAISHRLRVPDSEGKEEGIIPSGFTNLRSPLSPEPTRNSSVRVETTRHFRFGILAKLSDLAHV